MNIFFFFLAQDLVQRRGLIFIRELQRMLLLRIRQRVQALRFLRALPVNDQVPRDGEKPRFKFRFAVVLVATLEDADPGLLKKILGALPASGDVDKIAEQAVLILLDQAIEQVRIALLQASRDGLCFIAHQRGEEKGWTGHGRSPKEAGPLWRQT